MRVTLVLATALLAGAAVVAAAQPPPPKVHSIDETEALARRALAAALEVRPEEITVVQREERRWPDAAFGCAPRKGVFEPVPTDGYGFTLAHAGKHYEYRADKYGTVRRCPATPGKRPPARPAPLGAQQRRG